MIESSRPAKPAVALMLMLSAFASLSYQIVWTQQLGTWLGHEIVSALAVVSAFFGGLAVGSFVLGDRLARALRPGRWLVALELSIALWALLLAGMIPEAGAALTRWIGAEPGAVRHWVIAFVGPFCLLLPATAAMGATLPATQRALQPARDQGYAIGGLYAANTLGAMLGVLAAAFVLSSALGFTRTALLACASNLACAAMAWRLFGTVVIAARPRPPLAPLLPAAADRRQLVALAPLALSGLLGIGYEVVIVRALSQFAENTVYTYALQLALYLAGTATGAALYQVLGGPRASSASLLRRLVVTTAISCLAGAMSLALGPQAKSLVLALLGPSLTSALLAEAGLALLALAVPALAMGALFSHLCVQAQDRGWTLGPALAANTFAAAFAAPAFGVGLLPLLGARETLIVLSLSYLLLWPLARVARAGTGPSPSGAVAMSSTALATARLRAGLALGLPLGAAILLFVAGPTMRFVELPPGGRVLSHQDGVMAAVSVVEDGQGGRSLHINNRVQEGSSRTRVADARLAWLPLLLHQQPHSALFLGLGTGVTSAAAATDPGLQVDVVELLPEVIRASSYFDAAGPDPASPSSAAEVPPPDRAHRLVDAERRRILQSDARRFVRAAGSRYDVIVADLFHPARSGSAALFTQEHFAAIRARLADRGIFVQWLPLHQLDHDTLRSIVRAFLDVYPSASALLASNSLQTPVIGLLGRAESSAQDASIIDLRVRAAGRLPAFAGLQLDDPLSVAGAFIADAASLARFADDAAPNRDDHPIVTWRAARFTYVSQEQPSARLVALLRDWRVDPAIVFGPPASEDARRWQARIAAYWAARAHYIEAGSRVVPSLDLRTMLAQVREPLLATLRISPDFRPAYDPLLAMGLSLARIDPLAARELLQSLAAVQPARPDAAFALARLGTMPAPFNPSVDTP